MYNKQDCREFLVAIENRLLRQVMLLVIYLFVGSLLSLSLLANVFANGGQTFGCETVYVIKSTDGVTR